MKMPPPPATVDRESQICCKMSGLLIGAAALLVFVFDVDSHMADVQWVDAAEKVNYVRRSICILGVLFWYYGLLSEHLKFMRITFFVFMVGFIIPAFVSLYLWISSFDFHIINLTIEGSDYDRRQKIEEKSISYVGKPMSELENALLGFCSWMAVIHFTLFITHLVVYKCTVVYTPFEKDEEETELTTSKTDMILFDSHA
ncbi:uncharacterized protein LOC129568905 [Sitodiplosis mosellana]|uniref:uncharacterized protein LOC129568905 n=1 Tax=Sitodiplosis mosellana TaxID=263140 RepID=UPI002443D0B0|nr:uncharacterized protein LOC129568905 [Sitodiplosis mosellana]